MNRASIVSVLFILLLFAPLTAAGQPSPETRQRQAVDVAGKR